MQDNRPEISVIMGVYNQEDETILREAVNSILNQTFKDFELIIYNDGSDETRTKQIDALDNLDSRIRIIGKDINKGLAFSLNECIGIAQGRYIARMDADDISMPDRLQEEYDFLEEHPDFSWVGCNAEVFNNEGTWGFRDYPEIPVSEDYLKFSPFIHPTVMYRSEIFKSDVYRESQDTLRCEDYEMFMRLHKRGMRGYNIQKYLFRYREDKASLKRRKMRFRINETKLRYRNFKELGILKGKGWLYVIRPIAGGIVPNRVIAMIKRKEAAR